MTIMGLLLYTFQKYIYNEAQTHELFLGNTGESCGLEGIKGHFSNVPWVPWVTLQIGLEMLANPWEPMRGT